MNTIFKTTRVWTKFRKIPSKIARQLATAKSGHAHACSVACPIWVSSGFFLFFFKTQPALRVDFFLVPCLVQCLVQCLVPKTPKNVPCLFHAYDSQFGSCCNLYKERSRNLRSNEHDLVRLVTDLISNMSLSWIKLWSRQFEFNFYMRRKNI